MPMVQIYFRLGHLTKKFLQYVVEFGWTSGNRVNGLYQMWILSGLTVVSIKRFSSSLSQLGTKQFDYQQSRDNQIQWQSLTLIVFFFTENSITCQSFLFPLIQQIDFAM